MRDLTMEYSNYNFVGTLQMPELLPEPKVSKNDKGAETFDYGAYTVKKGISKQGKSYLSTTLKLSIVTDSGDTEYLDLSDYTQEGSVKVAYFRAKGSKDSTQVPYELATDPKTLEQCESYMITNVEIGDMKHETLSQSTLLQWMIQNRNAIVGKRVHVNGTIKVSEYNGKAQVKYPIKSIRNPYPTEVDGLNLDLRCIYGKNSVKAPTFEEISKQEVKKVPVELMLPILIDKNSKLIKFVPTDELVCLNVDILNFENTQENQNIYNTLCSLLNVRQVLNGTTLQDIPLEDFKYYGARFVGKIKSNRTEGELKEEELTLQEKMYLQLKAKTLDDIKRERGIKKTTNKFISIDAIPYDVDEISGITEANFTGQAPETVSATDVFAQPQVSTPTPSTPASGMPMGMPSFSMGLNK